MLPSNYGGGRFKALRFSTSEKNSNTIKTLHERHFSSWKTPFNVNSDDQIATHVIIFEGSLQFKLKCQEFLSSRDQIAK